jgi:hypothetical protein
MLYLYRRKIELFLLISFLALTINVKCQNENNPFYDYSRRFHLGFFIGTNVSNFQYALSPAYSNQDSINTIRIQRFPGVTIGAVADIHFGEYLDLRFLPLISISQRNIIYKRFDNQEVTRSIESSLAQIPVLLKLKSARHQNLRAYILAGFSLGYDLSSDKGALEDPLDPKIKLIPENFNYEYGGGMDFYLKYFKFSPEIRFSNGLNNLLYKDDKIYSQIINHLKSKIIYITLYFEG